MVLPEPIGPVVNLSEKVYVPVKEFPDVSNGLDFLISTLKNNIKLSYLNWIEFHPLRFETRRRLKDEKVKSYKFCCVGILPSAAIYFAASQCVHSLACPWVGELLDATVRPSLFIFSHVNAGAVHLSLSLCGPAP